MTLPAAALSQPVLYPFWLAWLDWEDEPIRVATLPGGLAFGASDTDDDDLNGETFTHVPAQLVSVSEVVQARGGANTVTATIGGVPILDAEMLASLDRVKWQGRICRLWHGLVDASGAVIDVAGYYTGYMVQCPISADPATGVTVTVEIEGYLAFMSQARGRTYQDQTLYDPGDKVAARIRASANGAKGAAIGGSTGGSAVERNAYYQEY